MAKRKSKSCGRGKKPTPAHSPHVSSDQDGDSEAPHSEHSNAAGSETAKPQKKKRQAKLPPYTVSTDQERSEIMEWVQQHPMLYDKFCEDYSNKEAKKQLYQQKALELGVEGADDEPGQQLVILGRPSAEG